MKDINKINKFIIDYENVLNNNINKENNNKETKNKPIKYINPKANL